MKTKFSGILTLLLAFVVQLTFAQEKTISGTISDQSGIPLPGVNIIVKGTTNGTQTDFDGNYSITANVGDVLSYSYVGQQSQELTVGASNTMDVSMVEDAALLDEVVVTALGIKRDKKSLGYATQEVKGDAVSDVKSQNFVNSLSGKVAGLNIKPSGTLGGSTQVVIRGSASVIGNNQALFVVDGVPMDNGNNNEIITAIADESRRQVGGRGGYDYGNAASDINPDDIESINVLKGAAASALYGSRAANGVIMITTKKGKKGKGLGITINSSITVGNVDKRTLPRYQKKYGAGYGPYYGSTGFFDDIDLDGDGTLDLVVPFTEDASYGAEFDPNLLVFQWDDVYPQLEGNGYLQPSPYLAAENDPNFVWGTSSTLVNSVAIDGGSDNGSFRLGYSNMLQEGNLPNSEIKRNSINFNGSLDLSEKLTASTTFNFTKTDGKGRYGTGYDSNNVMQQFRQWWQVNVDVKQQRDAYFATRENITWNINAHDNRTPIYSDNPYWTFYENFETDTRSRFYGNVVLNYEVNDWLDIMGRFTYDSYNELQEERTNVGSSNVPLYTRFNNSVAEYNYDIFANFNKNLTEKLNVEGSIGANLSRKDWSSIYALTNGGLNIAGLYSLSNSASPINAPTEYDAIQMVDGVFGRASFGYDNTAYVEGTFRRDRNSSLPIAANAYNYWSITGSLIFSQLIEADWLNFGKLRANYGTVGNGTTPYQVFNTYGITAPFGGAANASNPTSKKNPDLVPEEQANWEVGLEMKLFDNRLGFDVTYYNTENRNQIVEVPVTRSTGYAQILLNAGTIENKGVELQLNAVPIRTEDFEWNLTLNWDRNRNKVLSLLDGIEALELDNFQTGLTVNAVVGEPYGTIRGRDFVYHANGQRVIETNGRIARTSTSNNNIGDINPDWKAGLYNNFSYKNWNLSFLIDMQKGGDVFLLDTYYGFGTGLYDFTAGNNELGNPYRDPVTAGADSGGILFEGVQADGTPNTVRADATTAGTWGYRQPQANHVYDAGYIKLREASISYKFDDKMLSKLPFTAATISVIGRNLWIMDKSTPYADPEAGLSSGNAQGNQSGSYPAIREIGASVKLQF